VLALGPQDRKAIKPETAAHDHGQVKTAAMDALLLGTY
jgi:hypothetical protein